MRVCVWSHACLHKEKNKQTFNSGCIWVVGNEDWIFFFMFIFSPYLSHKFTRGKWDAWPVWKGCSLVKKYTQNKKSDLDCSPNHSQMDINKSAFWTLAIKGKGSIKLVGFEPCSETPQAPVFCHCYNVGSSTESLLWFRAQNPMENSRSSTVLFCFSKEFHCLESYDFLVLLCNR